MKIIEYEKFLKEKVFRTDEYNQFNLLFEDIKKLNKQNFKHGVILERSYMYDNRSIFIPLFNKKKKLTSINYKIKNSSKRIGIQNSFISNLNFDLDKSMFWIKDNENSFTTNLKTLDNDFLIIPNALHHISNFDLMMKKICKIMPNLNKIYIYDSYLREGHQSPNDYARHTIYSLKNILKRYNFKSKDIKETGNVFDGILYLFSQSSVILKNKELKNIKKIFEKKLKKDLIKQRDKKKWVSLGRKYATLTTAYSIIFEKK